MTPIVSTLKAGAAMLSAPLPHDTNPCRRGPIVLATDATGMGGAPILAARLLAARLDLSLEVVTVLDPPTPYADAFEIGMACVSAADDERRSTRETIVSDWVARFSGGAAPARVHVRVGDVTQEIARFAREVSATVVVVGAAPHRRLRHVVSGQRAAQLLRLTECPVLSVPPTFTALPRVAMAAVDFGPSSVRAALAALLFLEDGGKLVLTHVLQPLMSPGALSGPQSDDPALEVHALFDRFRAELAPHLPEGVTVETRIIMGDTIDELLSSADHIDAGLVAVGTRGPGVFTRLLVGSVGDSVLRAEDRAVLAAPPPAAAEALELWRRVCGVATSDRAHEWATALDAFTRRNAGRKVMLEVKDGDNGARVASHGYGLVGVTYEPAERQVEIMLGDTGRPLGHLTRSIRYPDEITLTAASAGRGELLDIRHGRGHTTVVVTHTDT